jgi:mercuric ion binding protein
MKVLAISIVAAAISGSVLCSLCESNVADARQPTPVLAQATDTATVRLHISGMTCGTCPVTARKALTRLDGVYSATVTLPDSLGVVKFNASKLKPAGIAAYLTKMTGYATKVLPDSLPIRKS